MKPLKLSAMRRFSAADLFAKLDRFQRTHEIKDFVVSFQARCVMRFDDDGRCRRYSMMNEDDHASAVDALHQVYAKAGYLEGFHYNVE